MTRPDYAIYLGLDVGKEEHHACGLNPDGERVHDKALPQDEGKLRALFDKLSGQGLVLVVVDQPATIGVQIPLDLLTESIPTEPAQELGVLVQARQSDGRVHGTSACQGSPPCLRR